MASNYIQTAQVEETPWTGGRCNEKSLENRPNTHTHTHTQHTSLAAKQNSPTPPYSSPSQLTQPILVCLLSICNRFSKAAKTMGQKFLGYPRTEATRAVAPASRLKIFFE